MIAASVLSGCRFKVIVPICLSACLLAGCSAPYLPKMNEQQIVSITGGMGVLVVTRLDTEGNLIACSYMNNMRPGEAWQPRGCQTLPPQ